MKGSAKFILGLMDELPVEEVQPEGLPFGTYFSALSQREVGDLLPSDFQARLSSSFVWAESPQGHLHWSRLHDRVRVLTEEDITYFRQRYAEV